MGTTTRRRALLSLVAVVIAVTVSVSAGARYGYAASSDVVVQPSKGAVKPVPGSGMGTKAALDDPRCHTGAQFGAYGQWATSSVGPGPVPPLLAPPVCVRPFKAGESNGGATSRGVTATAIKVVIILPSSATATATARLKNLATGAQATWQDAVHDWLSANIGFYETWGRNIDVNFYTSTGTDETSQRADLVAIKALNPFAAISFDSSNLETLLNGLASAKIMAFGSSTQVSGTGAALSPYRWGVGGTAIAGVASAEVIGKNLVGKKAQYAGSAELKGQPRKFGLVLSQGLIDQGLFTKNLGKYGGKIASVNTYSSSGAILGDAATAQQAAPVMVTRMKNAGVTTVVLFTDVAMNKALMAQATTQQWFPEWFFTGAGYSDLPILAQGYPPEQSEHAFGISAIQPYYNAPTELTDITGDTGAYNWYWGPGVGSTSPNLPGNFDWLLNGIHNAGPDLTPQNFKQGLFAAPPSANPNHSPLISLFGYGRTTGVPYDLYVRTVADWAPIWMDPHTSGVSLGSTSPLHQVSWYVDGGRRYGVGHWPKNLVWFDKSNSIHEIDTLPPGESIPAAAPPCAAGACPSTGATTPSPGAPNQSEFVVKANARAG